MSLPERAAKKLNTIREGDFTRLETSLHTHMIRTITVLNGVAPKHEGEVNAQALIIPDQLLVELQ